MPSIHRVIVRGHFDDLDPDQRAALAAEVDDHEIFKATYSEHGSFTYDRSLGWFNLRYEVRLADDEVRLADDEVRLADDEVRLADDEAARDPAEIALERARAQFADWGLGHKHLRATATDMATMWDEAPPS